MKGIKFMIAALGCAILLTGCANNSASSGESSSEAESATAAERTAKLLEDVEFPEMVEITDEKFNFYFKTESTGITDYSAYVCGSGAYPDEFGVFIAESEERASELKDLIDARIEKQRETYTDYTPDEMYKFDDCFVKLSGQTVYYAICADNVTAEDILS